MCPTLYSQTLSPVPASRHSSPSDPAPQYTLLPATHGALVQALAKRLVYRALPAVQRNAVLSLVDKVATDPLHKGDEAVTWRLPYLISLILDSPCHLTR